MIFLEVTMARSFHGNPLYRFSLYRFIKSPMALSSNSNLGPAEKHQAEQEGKVFECGFENGARVYVYEVDGKRM